MRFVGIEVSGNFIAAVALELKGKTLRVVGVAHKFIDYEKLVKKDLDLLLAKLPGTPDQYVVGFPLAWVSVRSLSVPFKDNRKIAQILPLEIAEFLIAPVDEYELDFINTSQDKSKSKVLVCGILRSQIEKLTNLLPEKKKSVFRVAPAVVFIAEQVISTGKYKDSGILLYSTVDDVSMVVWHENKIIFMRNLLLPDYFVTLSFRDKKDFLADPLKKSSLLADIGREVKLSLFSLADSYGTDFAPEQLVVGGFVKKRTEWVDELSSYVGVPAVALDINKKVKIDKKLILSGSWQADLYEVPLFIALSGSKDKKIKNSFDFGGRKQEQEKGFFSTRYLTRAALACCLLLFMFSAWVWLDYKKMSFKVNKLQKEQRAVLSQAFPDIEVDSQDKPLDLMRSKLGELQGADVDLRIFTKDIKILKIIADISARIPDNIDVKVSRFVIGKGVIRLKGTTNAFNNVNIIKNNLSKSGYYRGVEIVSATADKRTGRIRFEIKLTLTYTEE